jgi:hypothetical protein
MTDSSYAHIAFVADRSGSMSDMADAPHTKAQRTTQGIHAFVREQRELPGRVTFSLLDFDNETGQVESFGDGSQILDWQCRPRNSTALLDAIGKVIAETGEALEAMPEDERPGRVYVVIGTDGLENASKEYALDRIKALVTEQRDSYGWQFVYIGTELEAFSSGASMHLAANSTMPTPAAATMTAYTTSSGAVASSRSTGGAVSYTAEQRQQVADAGAKKH